MELALMKIHRTFLVDASRYAHATTDVAILIDDAASKTLIRQP